MKNLRDYLVVMIVTAAPVETLAARTDTILLVNGNAITGEVESYEFGDLEYGTDSMGTVHIDWEDVVAARVWLLVRAECPETGYTNNNTYAMSEDYTPADTAGRGYRRKLYTSIINLRNNL